MASDVESGINAHFFKKIDEASPVTRMHEPEFWPLSGWLKDGQVFAAAADDKSEYRLNGASTAARVSTSFAYHL